MTIEKLLELSPGLRSLYRSAKTYKTQDAREQMRIWYDYYKPRLRTLVGWDKEPFDPILSTNEAWDLAHRLIHNEVFYPKR